MSDEVDTTLAFVEGTSESVAKMSALVATLYALDETLSDGVAALSLADEAVSVEGTDLLLPVYLGLRLADSLVGTGGDQPEGAKKFPL